MRNWLDDKLFSMCRWYAMLDEKEQRGLLVMIALFFVFLMYVSTKLIE